MKKMIVFGLLAMVVPWFYQYYGCDIPEGISQPRLLEFALFLPKLSHDAVVFGRYLGIDGLWGIVRNTALVWIKTRSLVFPVNCSYTDTVIVNVPVRIYGNTEPQNDGPQRGIIYLHDGGFAAFNVEHTDMPASKLVQELDAVVFSVEYRLAPEHPFPAAFEDCLAVTKYVLENSSLYNLDPERIAIIGMTSGGNLATAVSLGLRDERFTPRPALLVSVDAPLQFIHSHTPSYQYNHLSPINSRRFFCVIICNYLFGHLEFYDQICGDDFVPIDTRRQLTETYFNLDFLPNDDLKLKYRHPESVAVNATFWNEHEELFLNPYLSPLLAQDLSGLPRIHLVSCQYDIIRDDAYFFERRLMGYNVTVEHTKLTACVHTWITALGFLETFDDHFKDLVHSIDKVL